MLRNWSQHYEGSVERIRSRLGQFASPDAPSFRHLIGGGVEHPSMGLSAALP